MADHVPLNEESPAFADPKSAPGDKGLFIVIIVILMFFVCLCAGTLYVFGLLAPDLKNALQFSQEAINLMFSCVYIGSGILIIPVSLFGAKIGPLKLLAVFVVLCGLCWTLVILSTKHLIPYNAAAFCVYFCLIGLSLGSYFLVLLFWLMPRIPPTWAATIQGGMIACYGVGGAACTLIYMFVYEANMPVGLVQFMMLLALLYTVPTAFTGVLMLIYQCREAARAPPAPELADSKHVQQDAGAEVEALLPATAEPSILQVVLAQLKTLRFWLLFVLMLGSCAIGAGIQANLGNIVLSLDGEQRTISYLEIVFAVAQAVGRVLVTILISLRLRFLPRVLLLPLPPICCVIACFIYFVPNTLSVLPVLVAFGAFAYGAMWSIAPTIVSFLPHGTRYGLVCFLCGSLSLSSLARRAAVWFLQRCGRSFGEVWGVLSVGTGVGPITLDAIMGRLYDMFVPPGQLLCKGFVCFQWGFVLLGSTGVALVVAACVLLAILWQPARAEYK